MRLLSSSQLLEGGKQDPTPAQSPCLDWSLAIDSHIYPNFNESKPLVALAIDHVATVIIRGR